MDTTEAQEQPLEAPREGAPQEAGESQMFPAEHVAELRKEAAHYRNLAKRNAKAAERLAEIEDAQKTEAQRAADALAAAQAEAETARRQALMWRIGTEAGLPTEAITRLQGSTEDELRSDAESLSKLFAPQSGPAPKVKPQARPLANGSVPESDATPQDPNGWLREAVARKRQK